MPVTYDSGSNIILVTGYSETTPCTFTDVYNADVAGGWGVVSRQCIDQFCFDAYFHIGDGSTITWIADTKKSIFFTELGGYWVKYIEVSTNAHFRLGTLNNDALKSTRDGCSIGHAAISNPKRLINAVGNNAEIEIFSSNIYNRGSQRGTGVDGEFVSLPKLKIYNTLLNSVALNGMDLNLYNVTITGNKSTSGTFGLLRTSGISNKINIIDVHTSLYMGAVGTIKNVVSKDTVRMVIANGYRLTIVNGDIDNWYFEYNSTPGSNCLRTYEFDLKLNDENSNNISGAKTVVWDLNGNKVLDELTNIDGILGNDFGIASSGTSTTLVDNNKSWTTNEWVGYEILITSGIGADQRRVILSNTSTTLTVVGWITNPNNTSNYVLLSNRLNYGTYTRPSASTPVMETPHILKIYKYGYNISKSKFEVNEKINWSLTIDTNNYITETLEAIVAAYTGITVDHSTETITISTNHTLDDIYDYLQYNIKEYPQLDIDEIMNTADGINYICEYDFVINNGISVTADDQRLTMVSGKSYTLTGSANFTGIIADQSKSRVFITIIVKDAKTKLLVQDCRVYIKTDPGGTEILNELTDVNGQIEKPYEHTNDIDIIGVARKATTSPLYKTSDISGIISSNGFLAVVQLIGD